MADTNALEFTRDADFVSLYANNIQFESSVWDLKIIFGQLNQVNGRTRVDQHTAVSISWMQAKLTAYYLIVNFMFQQLRLGDIRMPADLIPVRPDPADPAFDENGKKMLEYLAWVHDQFFSSRPYVPPALRPQDDSQSK